MFWNLPKCFRSNKVADTNSQRSEHEATINVEEDDEMSVFGYQKSRFRTVITYTCIFITLGIARLVLHWWRHLLLYATHKPCTLEEATKILAVEKFEGKHSIYYVKEVFVLTEESVKQAEAEKAKNKMNLDEYFSENDQDMQSPQNEPFQLEMHLADGIFQKADSVRYFNCKKLRYIWDIQTKSFVKLKGLDVNVPSMTLFKQSGLSTHSRNMRRLVYGVNQIMVPIKTVLTLLFLELVNPFYVFQVFSVVLWFFYDYYYYACVIILMTAFGITMSIIQTKKNQDALYSTVTNKDSVTVIHEDNKKSMIDTSLLVPGDLLEIPSNGCTMQCDAVLLSGNCILDESMLTGESVPVTKTPLPIKKDLIYDSKEHARHTLFCGTKIIQTRYIGTESVRAVVINTGNITAKGGLIRSILYPPPVDYKFEQDSYKFVSLLAVVAGMGFIYTLVSKIIRGVNVIKIVVESLDLITIAVPPALPAAMSVGRMYAQRRLKKNNIYCIAPRSINVSGSIDCVCFDKTGTLTEDGLDMYGVVPKSSTNTLQMPLRQIERLPLDHLLFGMVTCHSITLMQGERKGDPLDLKMFESTKWILEEADVSDATKFDLLFPTVVKPPVATQSSQQFLNQTNSEQQLDNLGISSNDIGIVREFSFTSSLQRMAVITRKISDKHFNVYCKGSPEMIATLCRPETVPTDFNERLNYYAQQGYRIIALAYKELDKKMTYPKIQRISRDKVEADLEFLGFVILENRLKPDSEEVIKILNEANIRTIMVTGDNILTAVSVAKDCDMVTDKQSIIIVNSRLAASGEYELFYTLEGHSTTATATNNNQLMSPPSICEFEGIEGEVEGGDSKYKLMVNSHSASSLETLETNTHSPMAQKVIKDLETGGKLFNGNQKKLMNEEEDYNPYKLAPELPSNRYRFAMDGKTFAIVKEYFPDLMPKFTTRGSIFARMSPDQKQALITELQGLGYYVAMCGDGSNDCGALKAAHTGISLSEAESSVASPFTSKNPTIACVPNIIKEGRSALVTSFGIFKYMAAYSLVQFTSVLILYSIDSNLTDFQFLYIDLFMISVFAFFFGKTESYDGPLVKQTPLNSLISLSPVVSLFLHLLFSISFQVVGWIHLQTMEWFVPFEYDPSSGIKDNLACQQNYTIFIITCFQYVTLAIVFSKGSPYRKSIFTNTGFLISIVANIVFTCYIAIYPIDFLIQLFELEMPPDMNFRLVLLGYGLAHFAGALFIEMVVIEHFLFKKLRYQFHNIEKSHKKFLPIENYLRLNSKWPPLSLYNKNENNSPNDDNGPNSGSSKVGHSDKDDEDDAASPLSYAEISIEANDDGVVFDRNSSILNSFFERERLKAQKSMDEADSNVFQDNPLTIRQKTQMLKREYLELQLNDTTAPAKPIMNGYGQAEHNLDHEDGAEVTLVEKF